jgi:hypothetical protein
VGEKELVHLFEQHRTHEDQHGEGISEQHELDEEMLAHDAPRGRQNNCDLAQRLPQRGQDIPTATYTDRLIQSKRP